MSDAEIATLHLRELRKKMPSFVMDPVPDAEPICPQTTLERFKEDRKAKKEDGITSEVKRALSHESYLCMQMTPSLHTVFNDIGTVVNSEEYNWVCTLSQEKQNYMKPDFFVAPLGLITRRDPSGSSLLKQLRKKAGEEGFYFGEMIWAIRDCLRILIEFKNKLSPEHFGKLIIYLQHLSRESPGCMYYGMLCDDTNIILASCCDSVMCSRYELKWYTPGSMNFVRDFVSPKNDWMELLELSMTKLDVQLDGSDAFLGMGRNGRVFRVKSGSATQAMKIVLTKGDDSKVHSVFGEFQTLRTLKNKNLPVVNVIDDARAIDREGDVECFGVCYLMNEVGSSLQVSSENDLIVVFRHLYALHSKRQFHGDARLANIISCDDGLLWIDFFKPHCEVESMAEYFIKDVATLTTSIARTREHKHSVITELPEYVEAVNRYANEPSVESLMFIMAVLAREFFSK